MIRFACPGCQATFSVDDSKSGKSGKCPKCQAQFIIPELEAAAPSVAPLPAPPPAVDTSLPVEIDPCPKCQTKLSVATSDLGNDVECPYCKTIFKSTKTGTRPAAPPPPPEKKSSFETDFASRPKSKRNREDDEDDRPRRRRTDDEDDEDDRPRRRRTEDDEDERPSRRSRAARKDADDEDERPSRRRVSARDDDEDEDYRPSRRRSRRRSNAPHSGAVTAVAIWTIVLGVLWLVVTGLIFFGMAYAMSLIGMAPRNQFDPQGQAAAQGVMGATAVCCGVPCVVLCVIHLLGGIFALQRKTAGRILVIICAVLSLLCGLLNLYGLIRLLTLPAIPTEPLIYGLLSTGLTLGYGIFALVVMCRADYAEEFE